MNFNMKVINNVRTRRKIMVHSIWFVVSQNQKSFACHIQFQFTSLGGKPPFKKKYMQSSNPEKIRINVEPITLNAKGMSR